MIPWASPSEVLIRIVRNRYVLFVLCLVAQSCLTLCTSRLLCPWGFAGKNAGVGCHALLQGIFSIQESNWGLLYCGWILILYQLNQWGIGIVLVALTFCGRISTREINLVSCTIRLLLTQGRGSFLWWRSPDRWQGHLGLTPGQIGGEGPRLLAGGFPRYCSW